MCTTHGCLLLLQCYLPYLLVLSVLSTFNKTLSSYMTPTPCYVCMVIKGTAYQGILHKVWGVCTGYCPTKDISMEFEIGPKFEVLWFEILHMSRQCNCRDVCKISLWSVEHISNKSTPNFYWFSNSIEILFVGWGPALGGLSNAM